MSAMSATEFQVVVFAAGKGSRFPELTTKTPKCLLPIGGKPLVWYPLQTVENYGFAECVLVVSENHKNEIQAVLDRTDLKIKIDYFPVPTNEDLGTADSLRLLHDKISSDVVCISCDTVTDFDLVEAVDVFRRHSASIVGVFFQPQRYDCDVVVPGPKTKHKPERDIIGIDSQTNRLVFLASASDFEENLTLKKSLLDKHTNVKIHSALTDSHIYVMKNWVVNYLQHEQGFSTIKGELLPHVIKKQMSRQPKAPEDKTASVVNSVVRNDVFQFAKESEIDLLIREKSTYNDHVGDMKGCYHGNPIRCFAHVTDKSCIGMRINNLPSYWNLNSKIIELWPKLTSGKELTLKDSKSEISSNQVDENCIIWEGAKLHEKTSFKNAIVGANCEVRSKTRVFDSLLVSNAVVKERCAIQNCIICDGAVIESGTNIKDCLVGAQHVVPENSEYAKEVLTDSDKLMEFE